MISDKTTNHSHKKTKHLRFALAVSLSRCRRELPSDVRLRVWIRYSYPFTESRRTQNITLKLYRKIKIYTNAN